MLESCILNHVIITTARRTYLQVALNLQQQQQPKKKKTNRATKHSKMRFFCFTESCTRTSLYLVLALRLLFHHVLVCECTGACTYTSCIYNEIYVLYLLICRHSSNQRYSTIRYLMVMAYLSV